MILALILFGLAIWACAAVALFNLARKHRQADWRTCLGIAAWPLVLVALFGWVIAGLVFEALYGALRWLLDRMDRILLGGR